MRSWFVPVWLCVFPVLISVSGVANNIAAVLTPPKDSEKLALPFSQGMLDNNKRFETLGYQKGQKVADFTLYGADGSRFVLSEALKKGKPIMLVSGSYTCDIARYNLPNIQKLKTQYGDKLAIYLVYTREAHPSDAPSPYSPRQEIWIPRLNLKDQVKANQPKTYGERKALAVKWQEQYKIQVPVLLDTPDNKFWLNFGQAPNFAYLIEPQGKVSFKQSWLKLEGLENAIADLIK
ncbi:TlpA family protein disulfide reductase [Adhaeribacter rhizoryzae]|uniref:Thioredoxin domain-containing protein n=1 Tax=Adhaeribacter rhizoryzae TaxID=2607907 RepID=A0A5M6DSC9_9BACT|nr:deiodinase-like protein [Adhaeribacter rhizoryzae]KAA5549132.1 hypothetical protein F0145_00600 [Adhaeribacter rhizoryzae]